jgi:hypothetical protein
MVLSTSVTSRLSNTVFAHTLGDYDGVITTWLGQYALMADTDGDQTHFDDRVAQLIRTRPLRLIQSILITYAAFVFLYSQRADRSVVISKSLLRNALLACSVVGFTDVLSFFGTCCSSNGIAKGDNTRHVSLTVLQDAFGSIVHKWPTAQSMFSVVAAALITNSQRQAQALSISLLSFSSHVFFTVLLISSFLAPNVTRWLALSSGLLTKVSIKPSTPIVASKVPAISKKINKPVSIPRNAPMEDVVVQSVFVYHRLLQWIHHSRIINTILLSMELQVIVSELFSSFQEVKIMLSNGRLMVWSMFAKIILLLNFLVFRAMSSWNVLRL